MAVGDTVLLNGVGIVHTSGPTIAKILSYSHEMPDRVTVDASDCSTTGPKPFLAAPDYDLGTVTVTLRYNSNNNALPGANSMTTALAATTPTALTVTFAETGTFVVDSWFISASSSGQKDGIIDATFRWKLNGTNVTW